jgi:hypothetical protein
MEPNTHMFANDNVDALNAAKDHAAWIPNGSQAGWIAHGRKDIGDKDVDEEVQGFASADTNVMPYALKRPEAAPKYEYLPPPDAAKDEEKKEEKASLAQVNSRFDANTENIKVSFLEPGYHQQLARDNAAYRGNIRTTFY